LQSPSNHLSLIIRGVTHWIFKN
jgi:hypothetical protein